MMKNKIKRCSYIKRTKFLKNPKYIDILIERNSILIQKAVNALQSIEWN